MPSVFLHKHVCESAFETPEGILPTLLMRTISKVGEKSKTCFQTVLYFL